ncbi:MAG: adenylate/guanylate cyclase domain-containing protein [Ekhidna sp.]
MSFKNLIDDVSNTVDDVVNTNFEYYTTKAVPSSEDGDLTLERGAAKKGKVLDTCVLFVDIRNSVALTTKHHRLTMAKIYTAFTKAMVKAASAHGGFVRNVIGDRVMIVFPPKNCFENAMDCAISINHICDKVINPKFPTVDFKCGIGIDYGKIRVIKVGQSKQGKERGENKGLVWVGPVANQASRLTDRANKAEDKTTYEVNYFAWNPGSLFNYMTLPNIFGGLQPQSESKIPPHFSSSATKKIMSPAEFSDSIGVNKDGTISISGGKYLSHQKKTRTITYPPILMSEAVYKGFVKECPKRKHSLWKKQSHRIDDVNTDLYGGNIIWKNLL